MPKGKLLDDTFEQLVELGRSTAKQTVKSVAQTFNPLSFFERKPDSNSQSVNEQLENAEKSKRKNHTPLNFERLNEKFRQQEKARTKALRQRLFQMVKREEERVFQEKKQQELQKQRQEEYERQKKERQKKEKQENFTPIPMGKIRRSIFSPKRVAQRSHAETKPSVGKQ